MPSRSFLPGCAVLFGIVFGFRLFQGTAHETVEADDEGNRIGREVDDFLRRMEKIRSANCSLENLGPGIVQGLARERFKQQALTAVSRANLLTYLWKHHPNALNNQAVLYMLVTNLVESDDQIFAAGNCYDYRQFNDSGIFCPYGYRDQANGTITVKDLSKTHGYDVLNNSEHEWFHEIRRTGDDILHNISSRNIGRFVFNFPDKAKAEVHETLPVKYEDGHWSLPYYDCGGGNIWMITYTVPFFGYDWSQSNYVFKGTSGIDIDLMKVDINQCNDESKQGKEKNVFANSHKCRPTTKCVPIAGQGFKRGSYNCACKKGFYFPLDLRDDLPGGSYFYNGTTLEREYDKKMLNEDNEYDSSFTCVLCAPGCESCIDDSPCIYPINWILRTALLVVNCVFMIITCGWFVIVQMYRTSKPILAASPMLLHIILVGALLSYMPMIVHYFVPREHLCVIQFWLRDIGFSIIYSAILFKTWRISIVFRPMKYRNVKISDMMLLKRITAVVSVFLLFCTIRTVIGRPEVEKSTHSNGQIVYSCSFDIWDYGIAVCKIILLLWGISLTVSVRKTPSEFNESRFISWAIYNETIMAIFFNVSMFFLHSNADPNLFYILIFLHIQLTVTGMTSFLFASKVYHIVRAAKAGQDLTHHRPFVKRLRPPTVIHKTNDEDDEEFVGVAAFVSAMNMKASMKGQSSKPGKHGHNATPEKVDAALAIHHHDFIAVDDVSREHISTDYPSATTFSENLDGGHDVVTMFFQLPPSLNSEIAHDAK